MDIDPDLFLQILLLIALTGINAFFAASEMAVVSLNKTKISTLAQEGNRKAQKLLELIDEPNRFLSTIQVAITLAGFFASASAATGISVYLADFFNHFNLPYSETIAVVIVTVILSYFTLVFGELFPKRIALQKSEQVSLASVNIIIFVSKIAAPFVKILSVSVTALLKLFHMNQDDIEDAVSEEEIKALLAAGTQSGVINETGKEFMESIFEFDDKLAYEIMTPRPDVYMVDLDENLNQNLDELLAMRYSRIPVYQNDQDEIVGILHLKDLIIEAKQHGFDKIDLKAILQKPYFVPESIKIDVLFKKMQKAKIYMAILIDEYGGFAGIVTMEDLVEEIVGDISDEDDEPSEAIIKTADGSYIIAGSIPLDDLNEGLKLSLHSENHETLNGYLIDQLGIIPDDDAKDTIKIDNLYFEILEVKDKCIEKVKLKIN
ncbi:hemolysin family protein [Dielma fastidiosa]|uniref:Putative hemolysin n=1 Tax=Dielma fastidiosa TaxID=1034346 RepID=A0A318KM86_9FIRM|nr:hemolysin family protein [Dielma fastidiosa]PXX78650.1 putative hemolysin [Dielma fastidiosa]